MESGAYLRLPEAARPLACDTRADTVTHPCGVAGVESFVLERRVNASSGGGGGGGGGVHSAFAIAGIALAALGAAAALAYASVAAYGALVARQRVRPPRLL